ncbi:MAG: hypothetical protein R3C97_10735 [Geminicoccaceae bacterium]
MMGDVEDLLGEMMPFGKRVCQKIPEKTGKQQEDHADEIAAMQPFDLAGELLEAARFGPILLQDLGLLQIVANGRTSFFDKRMATALWPRERRHDDHPVLGLPRGNAGPARHPCFAVRTHCIDRMPFFGIRLALIPS